MKYEVRNSKQTVVVELPVRATFRQVLDQAVAQGWETNPTPWPEKTFEFAGVTFPKNDGSHFPDFEPIYINDYQVLARDSIDRTLPAEY